MQYFLYTTQVTKQANIRMRYKLSRIRFLPSFNLKIRNNRSLSGTREWRTEGETQTN